MKVGDKVKLNGCEWEINSICLAAVGGQSVVGLKVEKPTFGVGGHPLDEMYVPAEIITYLTAKTEGASASRDTKEQPTFFGFDLARGSDSAVLHRVYYDWRTGKLRMEKVEDKDEIEKCLAQQERYGRSPAVDFINRLFYGDEPKVQATDILKAAAGHMKDRATQYDKPEGERSMAPTVAAFNAVTGHQLSEEQGWLFMELLKCVRAEHNGYRPDNYEDGAAYVALKGEAAARNRGESST